MKPKKLAFKKLEDYGIIGNLETCALIGNDGSIDWCCLPDIDSPSVFAAILDLDIGGFFRICPSGRYDSHQAYIGSTNVLTTTFDAADGSAILTDFMPVSDTDQDSHRAIMRKLVCTRGKIRIEVEFDPKFDYGRDPGRRTVSGKTIAARWQDQELFLKSAVPVRAESGAMLSSFDMKDGDALWFVLGYGDPKVLDSIPPDELLDRTCRFWVDWLHGSAISRPLFQGPWKDMVARSALLLKLLTNRKTGAVIAAPTTSIPEWIGGIRNWDYRYSWIRDSSFTVQALEQLGYRDEAISYFEWLNKICVVKSEAKDPGNIKVTYRFDGRDVPPEEELSHLSGYLHSKPVRVGNAAAVQDQLDIYGEVISTFFFAKRYSERLAPRFWPLISGLANHICLSWQNEDSGIWEVRFVRRQFTHSKLMCWVGLDRAIKLANEYKLDAPLERWTSNRSRIKKAILERGFNKKLNSFVQAFDYEALDATSLLIPRLGFLPANDPRVLGTIDAIMKGLNQGGLLRRYTGDDGLPGEEGVFVICSFWLVQALSLVGLLDEAQDEFMRILRYRSPLGLFSEEIDPRTGHQIGNFPQAFSHLGLVNAALYLGKAQEKEVPGPELIGSGKKGTEAE